MSTHKNMALTTLSLLKGALLHRVRDADDRTGDEEIDGKIVVVTGANSGIGKELTMALAKRGATVVMACRNIDKAQKVLDSIKTQVPTANLILIKLDLSDLESVRACAKEIGEKFSSINLLINNAGIMSINPVVERTAAGFEQHFVTNHLGHFLLTLLLLKQIKLGAPSRIVCVSSNAWKMAELNLEDMNMEKDVNLGSMNLRAYSNSKLCNMYFARELGKKLEGTGITTYSLCPGYINSDLYTEWPGVFGLLTRVSVKTLGITERQGIDSILYCALAKELAKETGRPYHLRKFWEEANDRLGDEEALKIWQLSEKSVGLEFSQVFPNSK